MNIIVKLFILFSLVCTSVQGRQRFSTDYPDIDIFEGFYKSDTVFYGRIVSLDSNLTTETSDNLNDLSVITTKYKIKVIDKIEGVDHLDIVEATNIYKTQSTYLEKGFNPSFRLSDYYIFFLNHIDDISYSFPDNSPHSSAVKVSIENWPKIKNYMMDIPYINLDNPQVIESLVKCFEFRSTFLDNCKSSVVRLGKDKIDLHFSNESKERILNSLIRFRNLKNLDEYTLINDNFYWFLTLFVNSNSREAYSEEIKHKLSVENILKEAQDRSNSQDGTMQNDSNDFGGL